MTVSNGQLANQTTFNSSYMSRETDTTTVGKVDLLNADAVSGASVVNTQRFINAVASALGMTTAEVYNFLFTYSSNIVGAANDTVLARLNALTLKYRGTAGLGHSHDGTDGESERVSASDLLDINNLFAEWQGFTKTGITGISTVITTEMTGRSPGGTSSVAGVITAPPNNRVAIFDSVTGQGFEDAGGQRVFGRVTEAAGVWTLTYFTNEAGVETSYNFTVSSDIQVYFLEVFTLATRPTIPSQPEFGSLDVTADVVDAAQNQRGVVNTGTQSFGGHKSFVDGLTAIARINLSQTDNTSTGADQTISPASTYVSLTDGALASVAGIDASAGTNIYICISNNTGDDVTLIHDSAAAAAANRVLLAGEEDLAWQNNQALIFVYDTTIDKWLLAGGSGGSGVGSGVLDLIENGSAEESAASIFIPYQDTGARPVDGTGGTPTVTTSVTATNPLERIQSFLLEKPASNVQGQGWAIPFTVDLAYRAKVIKISVDYILNSGTFAAGSSSSDSDVIWYIYDVTNSQLIEPSNIKMFSNSTTISDRFTATFQTSATGSSYRLIAHVASTSALAFVLKVDNVSVTPHGYIFGTPVTDWQAWTPTGSWVTNATYTGFKRRVGDVYQYRVKVATSGAPTAANLTINLLETIDTAKLQSTQFTANKIGFGTALDSGVNNYDLGVWYSSATAVAVSHQITSGSNSTGGFVNATTPFSFGAGDEVNFEFSVPIVGASSSVQMSDSAATNVVAFSADFLSFSAANGEFKVTGITTSMNKGGGLFSSSTYTIPVAGVYEIFVRGETGAGTSTKLFKIYKNGAAFKNVGISGIAAFGTGSGGLTDEFVSGDYIELYSANFAATEGWALQEFSIVRVSGPSQIAASEKMSNVATSSTTSCTNNSAVTVVFPTIVEASHGSGSYDSATGIWTCLSPGDFFVSSGIGSGTSITPIAGRILTLFITKNGTSTAVLTTGQSMTGTSASSSWFENVSGLVPNLVAGDTLRVRCFQNIDNGTAMVLNGSSAENFFTVHRI